MEDGREVEFGEDGSREVFGKESMLFRAGVPIDKINIVMRCL